MRFRPRFFPLQLFLGLIGFVGFVRLELAAASAPVQRDVIIVAGQSNVLNWHAAASELSANPSDRAIAFYYETGAPPERGGPTPFNATSGGKWTTLQTQRQEPFVKYEKDFFGPEMSLARALAVHSSAPLAVIKIGYFGTNLAADWRPDATTGNQLYARLTRHVNDALRLLRERGEEPRLIGFFWMQGETDGAKRGHAAAYEQNLTAFIARVRADFAAPKLPFVLGRVGPTPPKGYPEQETVRRAQVAVAKSVAFTRWVDTDDLTRYTDGVHLLAPGVITLGERMAQAWQELR